MARKIVSANIESVEDTANCGVCKDLSHPWFSNAAEKSKGRIQYKKIEIESPEGKSHPEYNTIDRLPHTRVCTTNEKGKQSCKTVKGWNENEFKELETLFK